jgi:pyruvate,water dikinase
VGSPDDRQSANDQDGAVRFHAAQYQTRLGVPGPAEVVAAMAECWESAEAEWVAAYRRDRAAGGAAADMAVIVQRLVVPEAAGVLFSADPVAGDRDVFVVNPRRGSARQSWPAW